MVLRRSWRGVGATPHGPSCFRRYTIDISWLAEIPAPVNIFLFLSLLYLLPAGAGAGSLRETHCFSFILHWTSLREHAYSLCWACTCHSAYRHRIIFVNCRVSTTTARLLAGIKSRCTAAKWPRLRGIRRHGTSTMAWHRPLAAFPQTHSMRNGHCLTMTMTMLAHTQLVEALSADGKPTRRIGESC